ncbi:dTDP-glucose 4,6-dehydratase-like isoform X1 [Haliotis cracherodii]|uniref:dTDP-glucose 4,6-dehydratase-like isoform X1 n=1 Tax=Haliotis cracherodii TaxID=6455 RepID=UPI0039E9A7AA
MAEKQRARVLILGGTGFIGRNLVHYLIKNELVAKVRVADKVPPQMAWLNPHHTESFSSPKVEFRHSNLINPASVDNAFADDGEEFDFVINVAAETKYGQTEPVYKEGVVRLSHNCAVTAARHKVKVYMEFSTGQMYSSDKPEDDIKANKEDCKCDPWTHMARHKLEVERDLENIPDLNYIIVRPAIVYGPGDKNGLTPRLIIGAIYKYMKEKMKMLWTKDLKMNTIHVEDLCAAVWTLCQQGKPGQIYNLVDKGDTTQGRISELVSEIFDINFDFVGSIMSNMAKLNMTNVVEDINDKHMAPWADACQRDNIVNTPLNPFIDQELLYNKHLCLDPARLTDMGFTWERPSLCVDTLREVLDDYIKMGLFPTSLLSGEVFYSQPVGDLVDGEAGEDGEGGEGDTV